MKSDFILAHSAVLLLCVIPSPSFAYQEKFFLEVEPFVVEHAQPNKIVFRLRKGPKTTEILSDLFLKSPKGAVSMEIQETNSEGTKVLRSFGVIPNVIQPKPHQFNSYEDFFIQEIKFPASEVADRYFKMVVTGGNNQRFETELERVRFLDQKKSDAEITLARKALEKLSRTVPDRKLTLQECSAAGGHRESAPMWQYGMKVPNSVCEKGKPLGHITGERCNCVCCK